MGDRDQIIMDYGIQKVKDMISFFFFLFFAPLAPSFLLRLSCCKHRKWEHLEVGPVLDAALSQQRQV